MSISGVGSKGRNGCLPVGDRKKSFFLKAFGKKRKFLFSFVLKRPTNKQQQKEKNIEQNKKNQ